MYKHYCIPVFLFLLSLCTSSRLHGQQTALKTNLLFLATTTPNAGVEIALNDRLTLDLWGAYNAWEISQRHETEFIPHTTGTALLALSKV